MSLSDYANGYYDVDIQLYDYLKQLAQSVFARDFAEKESIRDIHSFEVRRTKLKAYFADMMGGMPDTDTPLHADCTGIIVRDGYEIRKVVYQSLPGIYVTANLYVPTNGTGPYPAVVFACGHIESGKAAPIYQKVCIELVRNGMIVLSVDPISQGERMQGFDKAAGRTLVRWHAEHTYLSQQCELVGSHIVRYFVVDLLRSVDYLCTLTEVDHARIGITGNSGGGIQSIMAMIADDRIAAAAPCTYISSREAYLKTGQPQDGEQIWDGAIQAGMDYDDYISLFAPKPVLIGAVESDFFCIEGTLDSYERVKKMYALYEREADVSLGMAKGTHSFNDELRGIVVQWFVKQFHGEDETAQLADEIVTERAVTLQCTVSGQVLMEYADAISVQVDNAKCVPDLLARLRELAQNPRLIREKVIDWLCIQENNDPIRPRIIHGERRDRNGLLIEQPMHHESTLFFSEQGIMVGGIMIEREENTADRTTVLLLEDGTKGIHTHDDWLVDLTAESRVFVFEPRGTGVFRAKAVNGREYNTMFGTEYKLGCDARLLGRPLAGMRVFDVLRAIDYAAMRNPGAKLSVAGQGYSAIYALLAGIIDDRVDEIRLENMPHSFADLVETRFYTYDVRNHWYGVLQHFDLPELIDAFRGLKRIRHLQLPDVGRIVKF
ncbi:alpha/beta hydrolase family protein [Paenibacillus sp. strain BS8-2]